MEGMLQFIDKQNRVGPKFRHGMSQEETERVRQIWMGVLHRAVLDIKSPNKDTFLSAREWFLSLDEKTINGFHNVCMMAEINPSIILCGVRKWFSGSHIREGARNIA